MLQHLRPGIEPDAEPTAISGAGADPASPCWSPDSKWLVFADQRLVYAWEVGRSVRRIYTASGDLQALSASWREGHLRVVAAAGSYSSNLWDLPIDPVRHIIAGPAVPRAPSSSADYAPSFSPDGTRLAFSSNRSGTEEVWLAEADGANPRQLTHLGAHIAGSPRWSPDGKHIVFHARVPDVAQIYVVDADGGLPRRITNGARSFFMPSWSTDGNICSCQ